MATSSGDKRVTACIPYYKCRSHVRFAVQSLLAQTHTRITVVVINDGDANPPWDLLADIRDPRLVRFSLAGNHGPYFATAVALNATSAQYFLIQDADDWSAPTRTAVLLDRLERDGSDLAVSAQPQYVDQGGKSRILDIRWKTASHGGNPGRSFVVRHLLGPHFCYRAPHHGLFRSDSVRRVGGYFGGLRISYDTLLTNLILMTGQISHVSQPLYYRLVRPASLTHSAETGVDSTYAQQVHRALRAVYRDCFACYSQFLGGKIDCRRLGADIRRSVARNITAVDSQQLVLETQRLRQVLRAHGMEPL